MINSKARATDARRKAKAKVHKSEKNVAANELAALTGAISRYIMQNAGNEGKSNPPVIIVLLLLLLLPFKLSIVNNANNARREIIKLSRNEKLRVWCATTTSWAFSSALPAPSFPRVSFVAFSIDSIEEGRIHRVEGRSGREHGQRIYFSRAKFMYDGRRDGCHAERWDSCSSSSVIDLRRRWLLPTKLDEEDRASNKGDLLHERRRGEDRTETTDDCKLDTGSLGE